MRILQALVRSVAEVVAPEPMPATTDLCTIDTAERVCVPREVRPAQAMAPTYSPLALRLGAQCYAGKPAVDVEIAPGPGAFEVMLTDDGHIAVSRQPEPYKGEVRLYKTDGTHVRTVEASPYTPSSNADLGTEVAIKVPGARRVMPTPTGLVAVTDPHIILMNPVGEVTAKIPCEPWVVRSVHGMPNGGVVVTNLNKGGQARVFDAQGTLQRQLPDGEWWDMPEVSGDETLIHRDRNANVIDVWDLKNGTKTVSIAGDHQVTALRDGFFALKYDNEFRVFDKQGKQINAIKAEEIDALPDGRVIALSEGKVRVLRYRA